MNMARLLLDDEGIVSRREWWLGIAVLSGLHLAAGWLSARHLGALGLDRALMLFVAITLLIPVHSLNAKRFRAIGLPGWLALAGGGVALVSILCGSFVPGAAVNILLGLLLLVTIVAFAALLGVYDPAPRIDPGTRRA
jgi:uncharacterized membrane protein YhaH (DUF805 family)